MHPIFRTRNAKVLEQESAAYYQQRELPYLDNVGISDLGRNFFTWTADKKRPITFPLVLTQPLQGNEALI